MAEVSSVPVGRGWRFPFRVTSGGVEPNMPLKPTPAEVVLGIQSCARFVLTTPVGSCFMKREFGVTAELMLFENNNAATSDMLVRQTAEQLTRHIPFASISDIVLLVGRESILIQMSVRPKFALRDRNIKFSVPTRPAGS